jgi:hypothetical protein
MIVHTRVGDIEGPEPERVSARVKFWAEAIFERIKPEELYSIIGAALEEAYRAGERDQWFRQTFGPFAEVVDVEGREVTDESVEGAGESPRAAWEGPESPEPVDQADGGGSIELPGQDAELPGGVPEGTEGESQHKT